jgi:hypothetical protein
LANADDIDIVGTLSCSKDNGIESKWRENEVYASNQKTYTSSKIETVSYNFEIVQELKYLGTIVPNDNNMQ